MDGPSLIAQKLRYSSDLFRDLASALPLGQPFTLVSREHGVLVVKRWEHTEEQREAFPRSGRQTIEGEEVMRHIVEDNISSEHYFVGGDGVYGAARKEGDEGVQSFPASLDLLTCCAMVFRNGFTVIGESFCVDPQNANADLSKKLARDDAIRKAIPIMAYQFRQASPIVERSEAEMTQQELRSACRAVRADFDALDDVGRGALMFDAGQWARAFGFTTLAESGSA